jgi:hypothetical protein
MQEHQIKTQSISNWAGEAKLLQASSPDQGGEQGEQQQNSKGQPTKGS